MIVLAGVFVVLASICLGYYLEGGIFSVLVQPAEWLIIFGAALGALLIGSTRTSLSLIVTGLPPATSSPPAGGILLPPARDPKRASAVLTGPTGI